MKKKIFISYSHFDWIFANAIMRYLERRGYNVWIDSKELVFQNEWAEDIDEAIDKADYVFGIISADSVHRKEVIRELIRAIDSGGEEKKLLPIVIGRIHDSWFPQKSNKDISKLITYLKKYHHIEFNGRGDITEEKMSLIMNFLEEGQISDSKVDFSADDIYIAVNGIPESVIDKNNGRKFYKVSSMDLSPMTAYPFALDNQWIPQRIYDDRNYWAAFEKDGFASDDLCDIIADEQQKCLLSSLIHHRQIIINKSAILNTLALRDLYVNKDKSNAFKKLLRNGSIVVFLYDENEMSPFVDKLPKYETNDNAINAWNDICKEVPVYCIRENWGSSIDQHSIDFVKFCCTISDNIEDNYIIAEGFELNELDQQRFLATLKDISVQSFIYAKMNGTNIYTGLKGLTRSFFYKRFIVCEETEDKNLQPALNCIFDRDKPFHVELKRMVDIFYNSLFTNYFNCAPILPVDFPPKLFFLSGLYIESSQTAVTVEEIEYALSEFNEYQNVLNILESFKGEINIDKWTIDDVYSLRLTSQWNEYVSVLESIVTRSKNWQMDFSELGLLVEKFCAAIMRGKSSPKTSSDKTICAYSFRVSVGNSNVDIIVSKSERKYMQKKGVYRGNQNPIKILFQIGDITDVSMRETIFCPIQLFEGKTDFVDGERYFNEIIEYLDQNKFIEVI